MLYGILSQKHPEYRESDWAELEVLHKGGLSLDDKWRRRLLPRKIDHRGKEEPSETYKQRCHGAAYINYFGRVVGFFATALFSKTLAVRPADEDEDASAPASKPEAGEQTESTFQPKLKAKPKQKKQSSKVDLKAYEAFAEDADRKGQSFQLLAKDVATTALVKGKALLAVDMPKALEPGEVQTRFDEERLGLDVPYAFEVPVEQLIDWKHDDNGGFEWCILRRCIADRPTPEAERGKFFEEFKLWTLDKSSERPRAMWKLFRTAPQEVGKASAIKPTDDIPQVDGGETSFQRIPLIEFALPDTLWVGNYVGPMAREHFQRRSGIVFAEDRTLYAIPYVKLGPQLAGQGSALLADIAQDQNRGDDPIAQAEQRGWMSLAAEDEIGFASPDPAAYQHAHERLDALVDEIFRVSHQMAQSITSTGRALQRSGISKSEDRHSTEIVLGALGEEIRKFAVGVYDCIAGAREEDVYWQASGLDSFEIWDRAALIDEGTKVRQVAIPSKTFQKIYFGQVAKRILGDITPEILTDIEAEIEEALEKMPEPGEEPTIGPDGMPVKPGQLMQPGKTPPFGAKPGAKPFGGPQKPPTAAGPAKAKPKPRPPAKA